MGKACCTLALCGLRVDYDDKNCQRKKVPHPWFIAKSLAACVRGFLFNFSLKKNIQIRMKHSLYSKCRDCSIIPNFLWCLILWKIYNFLHPIMGFAANGAHLLQILQESQIFNYRSRAGIKQRPQRPWYGVHIFGNGLVPYKMTCVQGHHGFCAISNKTQANINQITQILLHGFAWCLLKSCKDVPW